MTNELRDVVGIDYSMSCPAITVWKNKGKQFRFVDVDAHYLSSKEVKKNSLLNIHGTHFDDTCYSSQEERFDAISEWSLNLITPCNNPYIIIEDYAFAATGRVFHIAENTGLLKHKLYHSCLEFHVHPPTVLKKFGAGKGNANKEKMYRSFLAETGIDLMSIYMPKAEIVGSPVGDIVDSYFACGYGVSLLYPEQLKG